MKNTLLLIAVLLVGACATTPTVKSVDGTYEIKEGERSFRMVLLENGICEGYKNGKKEDDDAKWELIDGEIHVTPPNEETRILRINKDVSLTIIAEIGKDGKRNEAPKQYQKTFKKIK